MRVLGVDVGMGGAAAVFGHGGGLSNFPSLIAVYDFQTVGIDGAKRINIRHFRDWMREHRPDKAYIENAMLMPSIPDATGKRRGMGAATGGRYMRCAGHQEAAVDCEDIDIVMVNPGVWKRKFGLVGPDKGNSIDLICQLCPAQAHLFSLKKHHNRAEAALIAIYGAERLEMLSFDT